MSESRSRCWQTNRKCTWIEPVALLYNLYFFGSMTLVSQMIKHMMEVKRMKGVLNQQDWMTTLNRTEDCLSGMDKTASQDISSETSLVLMYADIAAIVPSFFVTILLGGYSDSHGRLNTIMLSLTGASIRLIIIIIMYLFELSVYFIILSSFADSIFGMSSTFFMSSYAYLTDITAAEDRSYRVVVMEVFGGLGSILSNLITGYLISILGFVWSLIILLFIVFIATVYVCFLKESLVVEGLPDKPLLSFQYFTDTLKLYTSTEVQSRRFDLLFVLFLLFLISFAQFGSINVLVLSIISFPLCLNPTFVGYFLTLATTCNITSNWAATKFLGGLLGDRGLCLFGSLFGIAFYILFAFSSSKTLLFIVPLVGCCSTLPIPILKSLASKIVNHEKTGILFGSLSWAQMMGALVGIMVQNEVYANTVTSKSYAVFLFNAAVYALATLFLLFYALRRPRGTYVDEEETRMIQ